MQKPVRELRGLLTAYLKAGDRGAVVSDASLLTAGRVLDGTDKVLRDGPAGASRHGLGLAAAFFLLRSRELHCVHEHALAANFLNNGDEHWESLLAETYDCLVEHACRRLANGNPAALLGAECELEVELLERVHGALTGSGAPGTDGAAVYWLAQLRWHRFMMRVGEEAEDELTRALDGFAAVYMPGRTIVPPLVREYLQCLDPDSAPAGPAVSQRFRRSSADGVRRPEAARRVLVARVSRALFPGDSGDLALAAELIARASLTGALADVREAARLAEGVWQRGPGHAGEARAWAARLLVRAYCQISATTGDGALMEAALQVGQEAAGGADASTWQTWPLVTSLTLVLVEQATQDGNTRRLTQAVELVQQVSVATQARHESAGYKSDKQGDLFVESLFFTALLFKQHYDQTGDHSSLNTAAQYASAAASRGDASGRQRQQYGYSAAEILFASYQAGGSPDGLDNAITLVRGVLMSHGDSDGKPMIEERRFLAALLHARFGRDRQGRDQRENRKLLTELAREAGDYPDYPKLALLLTNAASAAASADSSPAEAREAASWAEQALALSQPGSAAAAGAHYAAGLAILALHKHQSASGELEDGIAHFQAAISLAADEDLRSGAAFQLARALLLRDGRIDQNDIDGLAQAGGTQGVHRHTLASMRAAALLETARGKPVPSSPERTAAVALLREIALAEDADTELRTMAARGWGHEALELGDHAGAATAFRSAIDAQPWQMWLAKTPGERLEQIRSLQGIGSIAATCAARAGMLEHSVESLERGRTIAWGQVMQMRSAARMAAEADAQLGGRFREALTAQEGFARYVAPESYTEAWSEVGAYLQHLTEPGPHPADLRLRLAQTWNEMVREARRLPGLEDVMRPPGAAQLRAAVQDGTVVLVNAHRRGSHALLVGHDRLDNVPLPGLEAEATARRVTDFTLALYALNASDVDYGPELRRHIAHTLDETCRWLWEAIAEPVLGRLGIVRPPHAGEAWPRIWWCPTGVLTGLPLHAAGTDGAPGSSVIDLVVSSYTVSLTALWQAPAPRRSSARSILVVSNDEVPGLPALPGIPREISSLKAKFPRRVTLLHGAQATRGAVVQQIPRHEWLHLACHASPGFDEHPPSLYLHDGRLRIERLGWTASDNAQLAYLSGCSTAEGAMAETDEAHHLAAALQAAGFPNVIGTIWSADDETGAVVATQFYDKLGRAETVSGRTVAEALHHTLRSVRDANLHAFQWAPYVHYGI
jgi:CHAT domain